MLVFLIAPVFISMAPMNLFKKPHILRWLRMVSAVLLVLHLLPESYRAVGSVSIVYFLAGFGFAVALDGMSHRSLHFSFSFATTGLLAHAVVDGAVIGASKSIYPLTGLFIVIHRLPIAMYLWSLFAHVKGAYFVYFLYFLVGVFTLFGYMASAKVFGSFPLNYIYSFFQPFFTGLIFRTVFGPIRVAPKSKS